MSIRLLNGLPLIVGGQVAIHEDCCCTPPCIPDPCVSPSFTNCFRCWDADCEDGQCLEWQSLEFAIDGVGAVSAFPSVVPATGGCRDNWDCNCDVFNSSFIHNFSTNNCQSSWVLREASPPYFTFDICNLASSGFGCGSWRISRSVLVRVAVASEQVSYTSGVKTSINFPNYATVSSPGTNGLVCCNDYTLQPGHYVVVQVSMTGFQPFTQPQFSDTKWFIYGFGNGVKADINCAEDQYYPSCGPLIGGEATLLLSSRYSRAGSAITFPPVWIPDCGSYDELCNLSTASVSIEAPVVLACPEVAPPPPPP